MTNGSGYAEAECTQHWIAQAGYAPEGVLLPSASIRIDQQVMPCSAVLGSTDEQQVLRLRVRPTRKKRESEKLGGRSAQDDKAITG
jgi:hypothetical protein